VRRLPPPAGLSLEVGWTGSPASTPDLVSGLHRRTWRGSPSHRDFLHTTDTFVSAAVTALEDGDGPGLLRQIRRARQELARLDDEVGLGIFTPELTALADAAEAVGGAAKPSGAGGGDCGIALLDADAPDDISHVRQRWAAAGVLPLPLSPAIEGIEE
jgi:phosphomevalonate kinase